MTNLEKRNEEANDWERQKKLVRDYFIDNFVTTKIVGESNEDYKVEFIIDMFDFYLKTSFTAFKEKVNEFKIKNYISTP